MARTDTLTNFLTDVANSIRTKTGRTEPISPASFGTEIQNLPSGEVDEELMASYMSCADGSQGANCTKLPDNITVIGDSAFAGKTKLALTTLPNTITSIGREAFKGCTDLALTDLPEGLQTIDYGAFYECSNLALTRIPDSVTSIGNSAFYYCTKLALTELPKAVSTEVPVYCFACCTSMLLDRLPDGIQKINNYAFFHSFCIKDATFPASLQYVAYEGLRGCSYNRRFTFLGDCQTLELSDSALTHNSGLEDVVFPEATAVPKCGRNILGGTRLGNLGIGHIYVPDALVDSFKAASGWSTYANYILPLSELPAE